MSISNSLSSEMKSKLFLTTKTVGADRIKRAKENNEDIAVLSSFLPGSAAKEENSRFRCALRYECRLGDPTMAVPGNLRVGNVHCLLEGFKFNFILLAFHLCTIIYFLLSFFRHEEDGV